MLKLLIVDDEPMFREGLVKTINWEMLGCSIMGEAYNGIEALNLLKTVPIDLIITDIRMPEMDGLELIRKVTADYPDTRFIVLSAFDDFRLVKEAFQLGIVDYILKSDITESELKSVLDRQTQEINRRKIFAYQKKGNYAERNNRLILQQLLRNCVERKVSFKEIPELREYFGYPEERPVYSVALRFHYTKYTAKMDTVSEYLAQGLFFAESLLIEKREWLFFSESNDIYLFYSPQNEISWQNFSAKTEELRIELQENLQKKDSCWKVTAGFSSVRKSNILSRPKTEAEKACKYSFFRGIGRSISYSHYQRSLDIPESDFQQLSKKFFLSLKNRNIDSIQDNLQYYCISPPLCKGSLLKSVQDLYRKYYYHLLSFCEQMSIDEPLKEEFEKYLTMEIIHAPLSHLNSWLDGIIKLVHEKMTGHHSLVREVITYIHKNYERELSLTEIADYFHINASYLSRRFSREVGKGFSSYVMELRINKALELMDKNDLKIYEVAERVGIMNPESFSRNFKKVTGYSPREYFN